MRRSSRLKASSSTLPVTEASQDETHGESDYEETLEISKKRRAKKQATATGGSKKARGKRGLLKDFLDLPLDVAFEIFGNLEPLDLLYLARTSKRLRSILMNKSASSVWKQSLANVNLPPCPVDLSGPAYAELAFGKSCYECQRNLPTQHTIWAARIRLCTKCLKESDQFCRDALNVTKHRTKIRGYPSKLAKKLPVYYMRISSVSGHFYDAALDKKWKEEYNALAKDPARQLQWFKKTLREQVAIQKHATACIEWLKKRDEVRKERMHLILKTQFDQVLQDLRDLGWEEELSCLDMDDLDDYFPSMFLNPDSALSEYGRQQLQNYLIGIMEPIRTLRQYENAKATFKARIDVLKDAYQDYLSTQPTQFEGFPRTADAYLYPPIKAIMDACPSVDELNERKEDLKNHFPAFVTAWREETRKQMLAMVSKSLTERGVEFDVDTILGLASTRFSCQHLCSSMTALCPSAALLHSCCWKNYASGREIYGQTYDEKVIIDIGDALRETPWCGSRLQFGFKDPELDKRMVALFEATLKVVGMNPETTTAKELEEADHIFECQECSSLERGRMTMKWTGLLNHFSGDHGLHIAACHLSSIGESADIVIMTGKDAERARERLIEDEQRSLTESGGNATVCVHCKKRGSPMALLQHVMNEHDVDLPEYGKDVLLAPETPAYGKPNLLWPPLLRRSI